MFESFEDWLGQVPQNIRQDRLWEFSIYRKSMYLADLAWFDCAYLLEDSRGKSLAWQLIRASGSIAANIKEGFGRGFGKDYARLLRIALGSARETLGWDFRSCHLLNVKVIEDRLDLLDEIIGGLVISSHRQRHRR